MNVCAHCGTPARPGDKFCSACGGPFVAVQPGYGAPPGARPSAMPQQPQGQGQPPLAIPRCQLGHDIAPGQSYCAFGHPIALDAMQFTGDLYAAPPQYHPYGPPPPQPQAPPPQPPPPPPPPPPQAPQAPPIRPLYGTNAPPPPAPPHPQPAYDAHGQLIGQVRLPPNALCGFLVSYQANPAGDYWALRGGRLTVGRVGSNDQLDIQLADATISSRHASITVLVGENGRPASIQIEDTGSTNGTFVNEEHLGFNGRRELRDGDTIRFGGFNTVVKIVGEPR